MRYVFAFLIATCITTAQLPPFRFIGIPERHTPTGMTLLMNDRILILSDDETSTWDQRRQRFYIYHRSSDSWSPLPNLDTLSDRRMIHVLNDSLICVNIGPYSGEFAIWNVDTDSLVVRGAHTVQGTNALAVHPTYGCIQVDQDEKDLDQISIVSTSIPDGTIDIRTAAPPGGNSLVLRIWPRSSGGFWIQTTGALWWTEIFKGFTKVTDLLSEDRCVGGTDGERLHVWRSREHAGRDSVITYTSPEQPPVITDMPTYFVSSYSGAVDQQNRVWAYRTGEADGFYLVSNTTPEPVRYARFDFRTILSNIHVGPRSWVAANTTTGLMVSEDEGVSWKQIPLPHRTNARIDSLSSLQPVEGGGITVAATALYRLVDGDTNFTVIGNDVDVRDANVERWYHRDGSLMGINCDTQYDWGEVLLSDSRGITSEPDGSKNATASAFVYLDTIFVRWSTKKGTNNQNVGMWNPGSTRVLNDPAMQQRFLNVFTVQDLTKGTWFGGYGVQWSYSPTRNVENIHTATMTSFLCPERSIVVHANERQDSLVVQIRQGNCYGVITHPLHDLSVYNVRQRGLPQGFSGKLIKGHAQQRIGILSDPISPNYSSDSVYILDAEMMSAKVRRFENIKESRVYDIVYDEINQVYYALTARGVYRSDPVITSIASDDQRPSSDVLRTAADVHRQTSWYNTLGQQIEPPTTPGLYLKIVIDVKGRIVTEKVVIP